MERALTVVPSQALLGQCDYADQKAALADIFNRYYKRIYNYMRYRVPNQDEAEELTSQVFERVLQKINMFNPERAPFEIWLFTIANHTVSDFYRGRRHRKYISLDSIGEVSSRHPGPEESFIKNEDRVKLINALSRIEDRERTIIALKFAGGFKNREIAQLMDLSENNVAVILYRSLRRLRNILEN